MRGYRIYHKCLAPIFGLLLALAGLTASAQPPFSFDGSAGLLGTGDRVPKLEAGITTPDASHNSQLFIVATMPEGAHIYSITQVDGGPNRTRIKVGPTTDVPAIGDFHTVDAPKIKPPSDDTFPVPQEEHYGTVKWFAPIQLSAGAKPDAIRLEGKVSVQLCDEHGCLPPKDYPFIATYRPDVPAESLIAAAPAATPQIKPSLPGIGPPAPVVPAEMTRPNPAIAAPPSITPVPPLPGSPQPGSIAAADMTYLAKPQAAPAADGEINWVPLKSAAELREIVGPALDIDQVRAYVRSQDSRLGLFRAILAGFLGGLILNVMPCVFPVIGLKLLSFVQQAGQNRGKAFMLNFSYSCGLLSVFLLLASLAIVLHLGWGELFGMAWFTISLAAVVFVMALSFMGVWEVPLPTFLGGGKTAELAAQEGVTGAFFKGVLTTFLATPCSAPLFAPAVAWATAQPPLITFTVFASAGLGMASPYLLIGAFPELLRFLPKPGAWMETFKQVMGFVLVGTVVYLLAVLKTQYVVPTVGLLASLGFMCWWVGRAAMEQDTMAHLRTWAQGIVVVAVTWIVMFPGLDERILGRYHFPGLAMIMAPPPEASPTMLAASAPHIVGPKTVLVDFSASWCNNCHFYENTVLRTGPVTDCLRRLDVVPLKADWSNDSPEVTAMLEVLGSRQIPVIAVFSASDPNHPAVFRGGYSQQEIIAALEKAGPSPRPQVASRMR